MIYNCHFTAITDLAMVKGFQGIFGTCSGGEIIVWRTKSLKPILKIELPKVKCLSLDFPRTGRMILSGWSDDAIRFFSAENGKIIKKIPCANLDGPRVMVSDDDSTMYFQVKLECWRVATTG